MHHNDYLPSASFAAQLVKVMRCVIPLALVSPVHATYTVLDLGTLGGQASYALAVNNSGQVVGQALTATGAGHAFLFNGSTMIDVGTLGRQTSYARGVNSAGTVVGAAFDIPNTAESAFVYSAGLQSSIGTLGGTRAEALGINNAGQIVGSSSNVSGAVQPFAYTAGVITNLGSFGGSGGQAWSINQSGAVVGYAYSPGDITFQAFVYQAGVLTGLGTLGGASSDARALNDSDQIVGYSQTTGGERHAFLSNGGSMSDLGTLSGLQNSIATSINAAGNVVGYSHVDYSDPLDFGFLRHVATDRAFIYDDGKLIDLNELLAPGANWTLNRAFGINDAGQIVGYGLNPEGLVRAFLLTSPAMPVPEPGAALLLAAGLGVMAWRMKVSRPRAMG